MYSFHPDIIRLMWYNLMEVFMMGKTSSKVKDRYNAKAYDTILTRVVKGQKQQIQAAAEQGESVNGFITRAISETIERDKNKTAPDGTA